MAELFYDFLAPPRIVFGWGRRVEAGATAAALGRRAFVVAGSRTLEATGAIDEILDSLRSAGVEVVRLASISREPLVADVDMAVARLAEAGAARGDLLLAVGGGSAIDLAKAAGAIVTQSASQRVLDYLEGVGAGLKIARPPLPLLAMPTTGGTGTEATKNAVISSLDPPFKKSLRSDLMVPRAVLVDPELSASVPRATTAWTGMDAITQLIESAISRFARPIPRALALDGLRLAVPALPQALADGESRPAREALAHAALLSGMALANSGLGLAHGVAASLGVYCDVPHGLACAVMLPAALAVNRASSESTLAWLARGVWNDVDAKDDARAADLFVERVVALCRQVGVPERLSEVGVRREQLSAIARGSRGNSMNGNPRKLSDDELHQLLESML